MSRKPPQRFVAIQECSAGNESVGDMWLRTATFSPTATLAEVYEWATGQLATGKLIIQRDETETREGGDE